MQFTFSPIEPDDLQIIHSWRYEEPYTIYNGLEDDDFSGELDRRSPYYIVRNEQNELIGFFNYGTSALVWDAGEPNIFVENRTIAIGLGLRPDLTSQGLGLAFVLAGLDFARKQFAPEHFLLLVLTFNERAIRVYEKAGFARTQVLHVHNMYGENDFLEMRRDA